MEIVLHRLKEDSTLTNETFFITEHKSYTVGHKSRNDFKVDSKTVARNHCIFHYKPDGLFIEALRKSKNGKRALWVNGRLQDKGSVVSLSHGDVVDIGDEHRYQLFFKGESASTLQDARFSALHQNGEFSNSIKSEPVDSISVENGIGASEQETVGNSLPFTGADQTDTVHCLSNTTHSTNLTSVGHDVPFPKEVASNSHNSNGTHESMDVSFPQNPDIDAAMQITIDEHDDKSLLLPLLNQNSITSESLDPILQGGNQSHLPISIKDEKNDNPSESAGENSTCESDLNQNIVENEIKIENPDIPSTNTTFFLKETSGIEDKFLPANECLPNENLPIENKIAETPPMVNFHFENKNAELSTQNLDEEMQIEIEEHDVKPNLPLVSEMNFAGESSLASEHLPSLENRISIETPNVRRTPFLKIRTDLGSNSFLEPSIKNQLQSSALGTEALFSNHNNLDASISNYTNLGVYIPNQHDSQTNNPLQNRLEMIEPVQNNVGIRIDSSNEAQNNADQSSEVRIKTERIESIVDSSSRSQDVGVRIKEERIEPLLDSLNTSGNVSIGEKEKQLPNSVNADQSLEVGVKEKAVDSSNKNQTGGENLKVRIKEERIDPPDESSEVEFMEERRKRRRRNSDEATLGVRIKQEKIDSLEATENHSQSVDEGIARPIKREKCDSPIRNSLAQIPTTANTFVPDLARVKHESGSYSLGNEASAGRSSGSIDYSRIVCDDIEFHEEKPPPLIPSESLNSSGSDISDCSTDKDDSSSESEQRRKRKTTRVAVKKERDIDVPEFKSLRDIRNLSISELQEYKRDLENSEIFKSFKDSDEVVLLSPEVRSKKKNRSLERRKESEERKRLSEGMNDRRKKAKRKEASRKRDGEESDLRNRKNLRGENRENDSRKENLKGKDRAGRNVEEREDRRLTRESNRDFESEERACRRESQESQGMEDEQEPRNEPEFSEQSGRISADDFREPEADREQRTETEDRNYPGARVLDDYDLPEERGRMVDGRDRSKKSGEKVKLDYKEYMKRRAMSAKNGSQPRGHGSKSMENSVVPVSTFRDPRISADPRLSDPRTSVDSRIPADPRIPTDPRSASRGSGTSGISNPVINELRTQPQSFAQTDPHHQQWNFPNSIHPLAQTDPWFMLRGPQPLIGDPRYFPYFQNHLMPYMDPAYQGRVESQPLIDAASRDPRLMQGGLENPVQNLMDVRPQGSSESQSPNDERQSRNHGALPKPVESKSSKSREQREKPKSKTSEKELVINPKSKLKRMNGKEGKEGKERKERKERKGEKDVEKSGAVVVKRVKERKPLVPKEPLESEDLSDELLVTIFSWNTELFENGDIRIGTPISELRNVKRTSFFYLNYDSYCFTIFKILLLDVSIQILEVLAVGGSKLILDKCYVLPDIVQKIWVKGMKSFLVPFLLKVNVPFLEDSLPPTAGDLLRISVLYDKKPSVIFGYVQKVISEDSTDLPRKTIIYLVSIRQQDFDIYNSIIQDIQPVVSLSSSMEKAKAIYHLKNSPLLPCILRPYPEIDALVPNNLLSEDNLVCKGLLDKKQLTAVSKILNSFWSNQPNICVVDGTAGTGKTHIAVSTILQILCANKPRLKNDNLRILVCASTNTELDEIIIRLNNAIDALKLEKDVIRMVVVGPDDGRRERTKDLSLSHFARNHIESDMYRYQESMGLKSMEDQTKFIEEQMTSLSAKFEERRCVHVALQMSLLKMYYVIGKSGRKVKKMSAAEKKELLDLAEFTFLAGANLIFSSVQNLNCTVMEKFREKFTIPVCIMDEAAQVLETDSLKVLPFGGKTLVLLGDIHKQSTYYESYPRLRSLGWEDSLFYRIVNSFVNCERNPVVSLITQYRMAPRIEQWMIQSKAFGLNTLRNLVEERIPFPLYPLRVFNLLHTEDFVDNEAVFASRVIHCIVNFGNLRKLERSISLGVIISDIDAKERVEQEIQNILEDVLPGKKQILNIEVDTIDGFQNHEKDIVLASCMRNRHLTSRAGFLRFYYTLSRAKHCLIIYGRYARIGKFKGACAWHNLVDYTRNIVQISVYGESTELRRDLIK